MQRALTLKTYIKLILGIIHPVLIILLPLYRRKFSKIETTHRPIFIVGAPRTGSTILYQVLTNNNELLYIDNLASLFHRTMPFGIWLSQILFRNKQHNSFSSKYGNTSSFHAPSESQAFWFRWFPKDRDFVEVSDIDPVKIDNMKKTVSSMMSHHGKDIIFKNLACGQRIRVLFHVFPNAKFIFLRRDPRYTAQSLLLARRNLNIQDSAWWSVKPKLYRKYNSYSIHRKLAQQIWSVEKQISEDIREIPETNKLEIRYEELPARLYEIQDFLNLEFGLDFDVDDLKITNRLNVSETDWEALETAYKEVILREGN